MSRNAGRLLVAVTAATTWALTTAIPAVAQPDTTTPTFPPVVNTIEGMWNTYVPANVIPPPRQAGSWRRFAEQFIPTSEQVRDFFGIIQEFRPPAPVG